MLRKGQINRRNRIRKGIRKKIKGVSQRPRLTVFRSNKEIYIQVIDDSNHCTLASASSKKLNDSKSTKTEKSKNVGLLLAQRCKEKNIKEVVFDRNGYLFHGRVKSVAQGAREGGLIF